MYFHCRFIQIILILGSDLDLFIHPGKPVSKTEAISLVERLRDIVKQRKKGNQLLYKDVVSMTNGRVPVLKYFHKKLELIVNVNFTSHTGVNNSFMVKHLLTLDPRIQPMILLLKIYFKVKIPDEKLTSFNLLCLIIFALQNNKDPVLPPLRTFLDDKGSHILRHEQRWPVQFGLRKFATTNKLNLIQLIMDFCSFYANFDFTQRVVSPYMGNEKILTKALYDFFEELKCEDHKFTFNRVINIQDFFVLCVNLGSNCTEFKQICEMHHKHRGRYLQMKSDREVGTAFFTRK